jgi:hypothetical protein
MSVKSVGSNLKVSHRCHVCNRSLTTTLIHDSHKVWYVYNMPPYNILNFNGSLVIAVKMEAKQNFCAGTHTNIVLMVAYF